MRLIIETSLSDPEIDGRIGAQSPTDKLVKKLSALITAHAAKTRQPQAVSIGEYREETGSVLEVWEREVGRIYRLYGMPRVKASEYEEID